MRPPLNAGENLLLACGFTPSSLGFNEAPAERGGKRALVSVSGPRGSGLQ